METPVWLTLFLDLAPEQHEEGLAFWRAATGYDVSAVRGDRDEFVTLVPPAGDPHLRVQRLGRAPSRVHLDLHVPDIDDAVAAAVSLEAGLVRVSDHAEMRSPGGFPFCFVDDVLARPAPPTLWPAGHRSRVDQLCLDVPADAYESECRFWGALTGWRREAAREPEFRRLLTPAALPARLLLQRREHGDGPVTGHIDVAGGDDRQAEVDRLAGLGAGVGESGPSWTVMEPPGGIALCVTDRDPATGRLGHEATRALRD